MRLTADYTITDYSAGNKRQKAAGLFKLYVQATNFQFLKVEQFKKYPDVAIA
jgi:hypothetical protein